ncbi:hypothetical protein [Streptomyces aurantiacus]|uniref:hypothetical protein n=1 Tax=Streptomyces aurantiacus TaxID=47760 RepID=UPI0006E1CD23|nr:hypothetical protein [Streptomyces aurantiacus]
MRSLNGLTLKRHKDLVTGKAGRTCSGVASVATAVEWELHLPDRRPSLTVHDNRWENGERDLVLYKPDVVPEMPAALSDTHNRLRSGITVGRRSGEERLMVYPTYVDENERPRIRKSFTTADLVHALGPNHLRKLTARRGVTLDQGLDRPHLRFPPVELDDPQDERRLQHALFFPTEDDESPLLAFIHFRVVPVLSHIGWLAPETG